VRSRFCCFSVSTGTVRRAVLVGGAAFHFGKYQRSAMPCYQVGFSIARSGAISAGHHGAAVPVEIKLREVFSHMVMVLRVKEAPEGVSRAVKQADHESETLKDG
jgi:hypothetical protein